MLQAKASSKGYLPSVRQVQSSCRRIQRDCPRTNERPVARKVESH